ncbi:MAG: aldehyde ferredoxin oxidoreductase family protein [Sphingomonadaceae bacterium]
MPYGYYGKILRVNLSTGEMSVDEHDENWYRKYLGGAAMAAYYLLKELKPGVDPLGPDNKLVMFPGVLTGVPVSGNARSGIGAKSPMTGGIGKSEVGGHFNAELKHAGFDGLIFEGRAEKPVWLWIRDGVAELRDAGHLWGMEVKELEEAIKAETGERFARVCSIGPGGEKMVRFACVMHDLKDAAGRAGLGAVMGSKKLKAIAVRGKMPPQYADPERIRALGKAIHEVVPTKAFGFHEYGTGADMTGYNLAGNVPTRNFRDGYFENIEPITAPTIKETIRIGMEACYACAVRCKKVVKVDEPWVADPKYGGPEYETLAAFGSSCGIDNLAALARAHHLCSAWGLDTISAGTTIAFAFECYERGYITKADTDGLELTWGNAEAMLKLLEMIAYRRGIGDVLAEGTRIAARRIGNGAEELAMQVKGVEIAMHEPRLKQGLGIGYAVANHGGDHGTGLHDTFFEKEGPRLEDEAKPLGIYEPMPANELSTRKVNLFTQLHKWRNTQDSASYCYFVPWTYQQIVELVNATTGWNTTLEELLLVGERAITMGRAFNVLEGFTRADDRLPKRFFSPPLKGSLAEKRQAIDPAKMEEMVRTYYYLMGWDPETGVPTRITLERLGLEWLADDLAKLGKLPE